MLDPGAVPHLITVHRGPLDAIERFFLSHTASVEAWFRQQWHHNIPPITTSIDLRNSGFKLAPVDTNLFPAGFNNLNPDFMPLCVQAFASHMLDFSPDCRRIVLIPENHTRNPFYFQSLAVLKRIVEQAGFEVRVGSLDGSVTRVRTVEVMDGQLLRIEPLVRAGNRLILPDFNPCMFLLNNDLSEEMPDLLNNLEQPIWPTAKLGWFARLKSSHFSFYTEVVEAFSHALELDPWWINPYFSAVEGVDFMAKEGMEKLVEVTDALLIKIKRKYQEYGINEKPFVVIKADNGTYGMGIMTVHSAQQIRELNRKQRTRMSSSKGGGRVDRVMVQEGVFTFETTDKGAVAEPVVYMIGAFVVGGFYRVHTQRGRDENLNAPGMEFEPLSFAEPCNMPSKNPDSLAHCNRFYTYGVVARLAALAAAREMQSVGEIR